MEYVIHTLKNGATVLSISAHPFTFSDGTTSAAQSKELVDYFTLRREFIKIGEIKGMSVNETKFILSPDKVECLKELSKTVDLVILPFPVLSALLAQGVRHQVPNCVAFNATKETQREAPDKKVVDIDNWSY